MPELISVLEFARRVGVDESLIRRHIKQCSFSADAVIFDEKGRKKISFEIAKSEFEALGIGLDKSRRMQPKSDSPNPDIESGSNVPASTSTNPVVMLPAALPNGKDIPAIEASRKKTEYFAAATAEAKYLQMIGDLVPRAQVYQQLFDAGVEIRQGLQSIPDQIVDAVMAARTRAEAHKIIYDAVEKQLERITADGMLDKKDEED